jgi:ATP-dependent protease ClpP protease subunit
MPMTKNPVRLPSSAKPDVRLFGSVDPAMLSEFLRQQAQAPQDKSLVFELSTDGGDADVGRRIAEELRLWQEGGRELFFLGKTYVFSAGITIMAAIPPSHRFLTADTELLVHERKIKKTIRLDGALRSCRAAVQDVLAEIAAFAAGSRMTVEEIEQRVMDKAWYLTAQEARSMGLVAGVV